MTNNDDYIIEEVLTEKKLFRKQKISCYRLSTKEGFVFAVKETKDGFDEIIAKYDKYKSDPIYKVFKLGSGEFQIFQKSNFQKDGNWYWPVGAQTTYGITATNISYEYFDTLDDACKKLLEYEKIAAREIKESVECV